MEDIKFLRDQYERERIENLRTILHVLDEPVIDERTKFAKRFLYALIKSAGERRQHIVQHQATKYQHPTSDTHVRVRPLPQPKILKPEPQIEPPKAKPQPEIPPLQQPQLIPFYPRKEPSHFIQQPQQEKKEPPKEERREPKKEEPKEIEKLPPLEAPAPPQTNTLTPLPQLTKNTTIQNHPLIKAGERTLVYAKIQPNKTGQQTYILIEPPINEVILNDIKTTIERKLTKDTGILKDNDELQPIIKKALEQYHQEYTNEAYQDYKYYLWRDYLKTGKIDPLLADKHISMITCYGVGKPLSISFSGTTLSTTVIYNTLEELQTTLTALTKLTGKPLDKHNPILDVIHHPFRIEATYAKDNSKFIIRRIAPN